MKMKKIIAWLSAMALVSTMFVTSVSAANANPTLTYTDVNANQDVTDDTLAIEIPANITWTWEVITVSFKDQTWNKVHVGSWTAVDLSNFTNVTASWVVAGDSWIINITTESWSSITKFTVAFNSDNNTPTWIYTVNVVGTNWVWVGTFYVNWANEVKVSAAVEPILIMSMNNSPIWFWQLEVDQLKTATRMVSISTNAAWWVSLLVQSSNTWTMVDALNPSNVIKAASGVTVDMSTWSDEDNYWYWIRVKSTSSWTDIWWYISNALIANSAFTNWTSTWFWPMAFTATPVAAQTAWWSNWATVEIEYWVRISALQPAWQYADTVTYTVTWNF